MRGEGLFISAIRKLGQQDHYHLKNLKKSEFQPDKSDLTITNQSDRFSKDRIIKRNNEVYAVPCNMDDYLNIYINLKVLKPGTKVFVVKNKSYLPSHELALSTMLKNDVFPVNEINLSESLSFLKRDNFTLRNVPKGWNILTYKGVNLGFVNNIGERLNNYYPMEWRIRMNLPEPGKENILAWDL